MRGGWNRKFQPQCSAEIYYPTAGAFFSVGDMTEARSDHAALLIWVKPPIDWLKPTLTPIVTPAASTTPTVGAAAMPKP